MDKKIFADKLAEEGMTPGEIGIVFACMENARREEREEEEVKYDQELKLFKIQVDILDENLQYLSNVGNSLFSDYVGKKYDQESDENCVTYLYEFKYADIPFIVEFTFNYGEVYLECELDRSVSSFLIEGEDDISTCVSSPANIFKISS